MFKVDKTRHWHVYKPYKGAYTCNICGLRIPASMLEYALRHGATLAIKE